MTGTVMPSASLVGVIASVEPTPVITGDAPLFASPGAFAQVLAAIESEVAEVDATASPEAQPLPDVIDALPSTASTPAIAMLPPAVPTTTVAFEPVDPSPMAIPPRLEATPLDDATIATAPMSKSVTLDELPQPIELQPIEPQPIEPQPIEPQPEPDIMIAPRLDLVRAAPTTELAPPVDAEIEWTPIVDTVLARPEPALERPIDGHSIPVDTIATPAGDERPIASAVDLARPLPPTPPTEPTAPALPMPPALESIGDEIDAADVAMPSAAPEASTPAPVAPPPREPIIMVTHDAPTIVVEHAPRAEPTGPVIADAPAPLEARAAATNAAPAPVTTRRSFERQSSAAPAISATEQRATVDVEPTSIPAQPTEAHVRATTPTRSPAEPTHPAAPRDIATTPAPTRAPAVATRATIEAPTIAATPTTDTPTRAAMPTSDGPTRTSTPTPTADASAPPLDPMPTIDAMPAIDAMPTAEPPAREAGTPTPASPLDTSTRAPIEAPPKPPIVLARAEDLALAIEELRPIPKGGATVEVEAPGLGAIRLHVAVDGDAVKIRIHAGSDAIAWFAREHDGLCSAARQAVPESQSVDLQLHTGADSRNGQSQPHARTYASDDAPQPQRVRTPSPRSEAAPSPSSPHSLVDVLA